MKEDSGTPRCQSLCDRPSPAARHRCVQSAPWRPFLATDNARSPGPGDHHGTSTHPGVLANPLLEPPDIVASSTESL